MSKNILTLAAMIALGVCVAFSGTAAGGAADEPEADHPIQGTWNCDTTQSNAGDAKPNALVNWPLQETDTIEALSPTWNHGMARARVAPVATYVVPSDANQPATTPFYDYYLGYVKTGAIYIQVGVSPTDSSMTYFVGTTPSGKSHLNGSHWNIVYPIGEERGYDFTASFTKLQGRFGISYPNLTQVCTQDYPTPPPTPPAPPPSGSLNTTCHVVKTGDNYSTTEDLRITIMAKDKNDQAYWWQGVATERNPDRTSGPPRVIYEYNIFRSHGERIAIEINDITGSYFIATTKSENWNNSVWTVVYPELKNGFTFTNVSSDSMYPLGDLSKGFDVVFKDGYQRCDPVPAH
jgi:hypothetical protein